MTTFDFLQSIEPNVVEATSQTVILNRYLADFQARQPQWTADVNHPAYAALELMAEGEFEMRQEFNARIRQSFLAFASGDVLDQIGALFNLARSEDETDNSYRTRIRLEPIARGTVGTVENIQSNAFAADTNVSDVQVVGAANGQDATVYILSSDDPPMVTDPQGTPTSALISTVSTYINADTRRLLYSTYTVSAPTITDYDITAALTYNDDLYDATSVLARARERAYAFVRNRNKLGLSVTILGIQTALFGMDGDVEGVTVSEPSGNLAATAGTTYQCLQDETNVALTATAI